MKRYILCIVSVFCIFLFFSCKANNGEVEFCADDLSATALAAETEEGVFLFAGDTFWFWREEEVKELCMCDNVYCFTAEEGTLYYINWIDDYELPSLNSCTVEGETEFLATLEGVAEAIWYWKGKLRIICSTGKPPRCINIYEYDLQTKELISYPMNIDSDGIPEGNFYYRAVIRTDSDNIILGAWNKDFMLAYNIKNGKSWTMPKFLEIKGIYDNKLVVNMGSHSEPNYKLVDVFSSEVYSLPSVFNQEDVRFAASNKKICYYWKQKSLYCWNNGKENEIFLPPGRLYELEDMEGDIYYFTFYGPGPVNERVKKCVDDADYDNGKTLLSYCAVKPDGMVYLLAQEEMPELA